MLPQYGLWRIVQIGFQREKMLHYIGIYIDKLVWSGHKLVLEVQIAGPAKAQ